MQLFSKDKKNVVCAHQSGIAVAIEEVPDAVFFNKVLGDGIAIIPNSNTVFSPVSGTVAQIAHTLHAIGIEGDDGTEVLVHLGIDTVKLNGEGFTCHVAVGQHVAAGDQLMEMDIHFIEQKGYQTISPCIITNSDYIKNLEFETGAVIGGETVVMTYKK
jgi:PTS system glucose-specific IIA component